LAVAGATPLSAQTVKAGIDAWQQAEYSRAVEIWRPLAEKGNPDAEFNLGQAYRLGRGVPLNIGAAITWFERAANKGHIDAQTTLGLLLFQNGDHANGLKWLKAAAEKNEPRAELIYGTALVNGDGITRDPVLGYAFVSRAAAQGLAPARDTLIQLNAMLTPEQRRQGVAMASSQEKSVSSPANKARSRARSKAVEAEPAKATKPSPPEPPVAAAGSSSMIHGAWRIQLGAFSQRSSAEALYRKLSSNRALKGRSAFYIPVGAITRLQVGPFESKEAAASACKELATACFPVPGK
jgi:TPR repeat protein